MRNQIACCKASFLMPVMEVMGVMPGFKRTKNRVFFIIAVFARITGLKSMFKAEIY